jgi:hypothetical protein
VCRSGGSEAKEDYTFSSIYFAVSLSNFKPEQEDNLPSTPLLSTGKTGHRKQIKQNAVRKKTKKKANCWISKPGKVDCRMEEILAPPAEGTRSEERYLLECDGV